MINSAAIIRPVQTHRDVIISAVASRDLSSAQSFARKYDIPIAFGSYNELLDSSEVDFVYISLRESDDILPSEYLAHRVGPMIANGMHGEWAIKALEKGKHVLLEKPFTANAEEAKRVVELAKEKKLVLMEAFHWQCHPAARMFKSILSRVIIL